MEPQHPSPTVTTSQTIDVAALAEALLGAYRTGEPVPPLTQSHPGMTVADAYAVQSAQIARWTQDGRDIRGYKVGLTSRAMQEQLGVDEPDYGFLLQGMFHDADTAIDTAQFIAPKIEPEIALYLRDGLAGPGLTVHDVIDAVAEVGPALEIIDSRIRDWRIALPDTIADNASSAGVVLGAHRVPLTDVDVVAATGTISRNGEAVGQGTGAAVLGSPLIAATWLANRLGELGVALQPGSVILPGSVCAAVPVSDGDAFEADFGAIGTVRVAFGKKE